jgi:hypothetical protein
MKLIITILTLIASVSITFAQNNWCGFDQQMQKAFQENPALENQIYEHFDRIANGQIAAEERVDPIIIPVVVHILHAGDAGNISDAQVYDAMRMLNEDYNRLNPDTVDTRNTVDAPFASVAASVNIRFELAKFDPQGNCTNGIERRDSYTGSYGANDNKAKFYTGGGLDAWDRNSYFNIWVVNSIENNSGSGTILGYGQFPMWGSADTYGFVVRHDAFGSIGTANGDRTVTHELGHCLGLYHTFQDGCGNNSSSCSSQGDGCCDTPPVNEPHWSCVTTQNYCSQIPNGDAYGFDALDQFENYMSYSPCQNMFSEDQKNIIQANLASIPFMINLVSLSNQMATGVDQAGVLCNVDFISDKNVICEGDSISFSDVSFHNVNSRTWQFTNGSPQVSTDSNLYVSYNTPGVYEVSLLASDGTNSQTKVVSNYVSVLPLVGTPLPYFEGFNSVTTFPNNFDFFTNASDMTSNWTLQGASEKYLELQSYNFIPNTYSEFSSGTIDLTSVPYSELLYFSFDYAYYKKNANTDDLLKIYGKTSCSSDWTIFASFTADQLNQVENAQPFSPSSSDWQNKTFVIAPPYHNNNSNFRYKFSFESVDGNNIYIDNINISNSLVDINKNQSINTINVFPNPTLDVTYLDFNTTINQKIDIKLYNSLGQEIYTIFSGVLSNGKYKYTVPLNEYQKGIYYIKINGEYTSQTVKTIKN